MLVLAQDSRLSFLSIFNWTFYVIGHLGKGTELFFWIPIEGLIHSRQKEYYDALRKADQIAGSSEFVSLMLEIIRDSLKEISAVESARHQGGDQVGRLLSALGNETLSSSELMKRLNLCQRPTFRKNYLNPALKANVIERTIPDKANSSNQKYRKVKSRRVITYFSLKGECYFAKIQSATLELLKFFKVTLWDS